MIAEFAKTKEHIHKADFQIMSGNRKTINYLKRKNIAGKILDIGQESPLTSMISNNFDVWIDNTIGDLDGDFITPGSDDYDVVVFSHTLEHIFDPVHCLLEIKKVLKPRGDMFIFLPRRGKLLWTPNHYHEIDHYRFQMLMKRTGFEIIGWEHHKAWRAPLQYFTGIRSLFRIFREFNIAYHVRPKQQEKEMANKDIKLIEKELEKKEIERQSSPQWMRNILVPWYQDSRYRK